MHTISCSDFSTNNLDSSYFQQQYEYMKHYFAVNLLQIELINSSKSEANDYLMRVGKK